MAINEMMMELIEELTQPDEIALDHNVEETIEAEVDAIFGTSEEDDDVIDFVASGGRLGYQDPVDFS